MLLTEAELRELTELEQPEAQRRRLSSRGWPFEVSAKGRNRLQDLRKKWLTDEFVAKGENEKGGHKTQAMADYYRLIKPPKRAQNTLVNLRKAGAK